MALEEDLLDLLELLLLLLDLLEVWEDDDLLVDDDLLADTVEAVDLLDCEVAATLPETGAIASEKTATTKIKKEKRPTAIRNVRPPVNSTSIKNNIIYLYY